MANYTLTHGHITYTFTYGKAINTIKHITHWPLYLKRNKLGGLQFLLKQNQYNLALLTGVTLTDMLLVQRLVRLFYL